MSGQRGVRINLGAGDPISRQKPSFSSKKTSRVFSGSDSEDEFKFKQNINDMIHLTAEAEIKKIQLQTEQAASRIHEKTLRENPDLFDYDKAYETAKRREERRKREAEDIDNVGSYKPRYVDSIFSATARRKLELERVEIKNARRQRELEKDEVGEVEEFITPSYRRKLAEIEHLEAEERTLEELGKGSTRSAGLLAFYKGILDRRTGSSDGSIKKDSSKQPSNAYDEGSSEEENVASEFSSVKEDQLKNGRVELNDSEEIVDKTQLFRGGLNITDNAIRRELRIKKGQKHAKEPKSGEIALQHWGKRGGVIYKDAIDLRKDIIRQREEAMDRERKKKESELLRLKESLANKFTEEVITSAKERYAARKKLRKENDSYLD